MWPRRVLLVSIHSQSALFWCVEEASPAQSAQVLIPNANQSHLWIGVEHRRLHRRHGRAVCEPHVSAVALACLVASPGRDAHAHAVGEQ